MIEGTTITLGGVEYTLPDLNFKTVKKIFPQIQMLLKPSDDGYLDAITKVIHAGLVRNYPDITEDYIDEKMSVPEMEEIVVIIQTQITKKKLPAIPAPMTSL